MRELSLFTGAGGGLLGTRLLGFRPIGYVEWEPYCQAILAQRIKDGLLEEAPIFGDIREFVKSGAAREYRGFADVVTAGFPCQPFSTAGAKRGESDAKNMWPATADVVRIVRPEYIFLENVPGVLSKYGAIITAALAEMGYVGQNGVLSAAGEGATHIRSRVWFCCHSNNNGESVSTINDETCRMQAHDADTELRKRSLGRNLSGTWWNGKLAEKYDRLKRTHTSERVGVDDGMAYRMDRLKAIGNGQVPAVVRRAWLELGA